MRGVLGGGWGALCLDERLWVLMAVDVVEIICEVRGQVEHFSESIKQAARHAGRHLKLKRVVQGLPETKRTRADNEVQLSWHDLLYLVPLSYHKYIEFITPVYRVV